MWPFTKTEIAGGINWREPSGTEQATMGICERSFLYSGAGLGRLCIMGLEYCGPPKRYRPFIYYYTPEKQPALFYSRAVIQGWQEAESFCLHFAKICFGGNAAAAIINEQAIGRLVYSRGEHE